ncbi:MAG TPA: leucine-rich repeat domain-containing protein [Pirellulales bacterium]|jgi:hypothetical protein|nr:leucine-rich repeat domain-containing protein [Pirellulales bacterium]
MIENPTKVDSSAPPKRHRWCQYSLRSLLAFTALCAVAARWVGDPVIKARQQATSAQAIRASGGQVYTCRGKPIVPDWMRTFYAPELAASVSHVELPRDSGDAEFALLDGVPDLLYLMSSGSQVTDAGLAHLSALTELQGLNLSNTRITDAGLSRLKGLTNLKDVRLSHTQISDAGLEQLKSMGQLQSLWLDRTRVTKDGVRRLRQALPRCSSIVGP